MFEQFLKAFPASELITHMMPYAYDSVRIFVDGIESDEGLVSYLQKLTRYNGSNGLITRARQWQFPLHAGRLGGQGRLRRGQSHRPYPPRGVPRHPIPTPTPRSRPTRTLPPRTRRSRPTHAPSTNAN